MPKFAAAAVLDNGLNHVKNNAVKLAVLSTYAAGDSAATIATNKLAEATVASADYTLSSSGSNRVLTCAAKSTGNASASSTGNLHVAHLDSAGAALIVVDATDQAVTAGNPFDLPAHTYTSEQPI